MYLYMNTFIYIHVCICIYIYIYICIWVRQPLGARRLEDAKKLSLQFFPGKRVGFTPTLTLPQAPKCFRQSQLNPPVGAKRPLFSYVFLFFFLLCFLKGFGTIFE